MRDPALLEQSWPSLWHVMGPIGDLLLRERASDSRLRGLQQAFGPDPAQEVPPEQVILNLRCKVGELLGLSADESDEHHAASPWRHRVVARV